MKTRMFAPILALFIFLGIAVSPVHAQFAKRTGSQIAASQAAPPLTGRQACASERSIFPLRFNSPHGAIHGVHFVKDGLLLDLHKNKQEFLPYAEISKIDFSPGAFSHADLYVHMNGKRGSYFLEFLLTQASNDTVVSLQRALITMAQLSNQGHPFLCSDNAQDFAEALVDFQQKTASWRALSTKPAISEDVYKFRLLAEDSLKNRDLNAAANYYEQGIDSDPTWAQGWYNAALVYAELKQYADAADSMKHYVALLPDAPDVQPAKDNIILWEAKAPRTSASASSLQSASLTPGTRKK
jgi:tetratricopeptide (TPR) repeat protein